jgi:hypothetical protein
MYTYVLIRRHEFTGRKFMRKMNRSRLQRGQSENCLVRKRNFIRRNVGWGCKNDGGRLKERKANLPEKETKVPGKECRVGGTHEEGRVLEKVK